MAKMLRKLLKSLKNHIISISMGLQCTRVFIYEGDLTYGKES